MSESEPFKRNLFDRFVPVLLVATIALAFVVGVLWQRVNSIEKGGTATTATTTTQAQGAEPIAELTDDQLKDAFDKAIIKFGKNDAKNVFIEVADPSCPFCHIAGGNNPELAGEVGDRFKYKSAGGSYIPPVPEMKKLLDSGKASYAFFYKNGHGNGEMGTKALYCAFEQGKYWEAHDKLYSNAGYKLLNETVRNDKAKSQDLSDFLKGAVDAEILKICLDSGKFDQRLSEDESLSGSIGITGTPGFYINTKNFAGAYGWEDMKASLQ
jgi:protein-disulfide isomerase